MSEQKLIFVTGKGGVGKSVVALALARKLASRQKVLLVELGLRSFYSDFLNVPVGYEPKPYRPNLDLALWSGTECLKEYALHLLKLESLYKLFFENRMSRALIEVAPALSELAILGKITSGIRHVGPPLEYDVLVIDCYATGHMMALLKAPRGMAEAIHFGPMAEQTTSMLNVIRSAELCHYKIVTLPEELAAVEADELFREIHNETGVSPEILCNKVWSPQKILQLKQSLTLTSDPVETQLMTELEGLVLRQQAWVNYLRHRHPSLSLLPMIFSSEPTELIEAIEMSLP